MAFTDTEKVKIRHHCGYLNTSTGSAISLGIPSANQLGFVLESAMNTILPEAEALVRRFVAELDCIEDQMSQARDRLPVGRVDDIDLRGPEEMMELESQYSYWSDKLVDVFGVPKNPFSKQHQRMSGEVFVIEPV